MLSEPMRLGIVVGLPFSGRPVSPEWALAFRTQDFPMNMNVAYYAKKGAPIDDARNEISKYAVENGAKYVWFLDDDVEAPVHSVRHLAYILEQEGPPSGNVAAIGGIYCSKTDPPEPIVFKDYSVGVDWDWKVGEVFDVIGIGTGCLMIHTDIFKHIEYPWFKTIDECYPETAKIEGFPVLNRQMTDDIYFCEKVLKAGYRIQAHGGVQCVHRNASTGQAYLLPANSKPLKALDASIKDKVKWLTDQDPARMFGAA